MADTVQYGSGIFKDAEGNVVKINGLTEADVSKIKEYHGKVDSLETALKAVNAGQKMIAYKDYYNEDTTYASEMAVGVYYMVPFNKEDQFLEWDESTGAPKAEQDSVTDHKVAYFWVVMKNSDETVNKIGKQDVVGDIEGYATLAGNQTFTGDNTFNKDITVTAEQVPDSLGDNKLTTAKTVRAIVDKKVLEAGHLKGKYYSTGAPEDGSLVVNELAFFAATNLIA